MKFEFLLSFVLTLTLLAGCSQAGKSDNYEIQGRIIQLEKDSMTVVNAVSKKMIEEHNIREILSKRNGRAVIFYYKDASEKFKVGQLVRVWRDKDSIVLESDPPQMSASKVEIKEETKTVRVKKTDMEGYVVKKETNRILVVSSEPEKLGSNSEVKEYYKAAWVSGIYKDIQIGQNVNVWFTGGVRDSNPDQARAGKVLILQSFKPDDANLSVSKVINKVLTTPANNITELRVPVIGPIVYDKKSDSWAVQLQDLNGKNKLNLHLNDE